MTVLREASLHNGPWWEEAGKNSPFGAIIRSKHEVVLRKRLEHKTHSTRFDKATAEEELLLGNGVLSWHQHGINNLREESERSVICEY